MEAVECGAACLTMLLRAFGHHAELSELREACGVSRDGVSAKSLVRVARRYGLTTRARKREPAELADLTGPAIIHWEMNHFVILERWSPSGARLLDPAVGPRHIPPEDFDKSFTGICIELAPGEGFERRPRRRHAARRYLDALKQARGALGVIAGASLLLNLIGLTVPIATQIVVDRVVGAAQHHWLTVVGLGAVYMLLLGTALGLWRAWILSRLRLSLDASFGVSLVRHLLSLPLRFFMQRHTGDLIARVRSMRRVRDLLAGRSVALLVDGVLLASYLALMLVYDWRLGACVVLAALLYAGCYAGARPEQMARYRERVIKDVKQDVQLLQTIQGMLTLKSAGRESVAHARWLHLWVAALNAKVREVRMSEGVAALLGVIELATPVVVLLWGAARVAHGELTLGMLLGFLVIQAMFLEPLRKIIETLLEVQQLPVHLARSDDILSAEPERSGRDKAPRLEGQIRFENVTFRYGPTAPPVVDDLSLDIARGEKVALVGRSGCGKSTLARLLLGLYTPESGRITLDGRDLSGLDVDSVRRQLGAVLQETTLFAGSIRENVSLYAPGARLEDVVAACRVAQIHDDIEALPAGYETRISPQGGPLSGGQRQRLALARAVLHRPPIMILDEATSALDSVTEAAVEAYLSHRNCTRVVIAHRLSTVRDADRIVVLDGGKIVEQGRHEELLAAGGAYAALCASAAPPPPQAPGEAPAGERITPRDLDRFEVLAGLDEDDKAALCERLVRRTHPAGSVVIRQQARGAGLVLLEEGELRVVIEEPGLAPLEVGRVGAGAVLGEVGLLDGSPASATLQAEAPVRALHLPLGAFEALRDNRDALGLSLILALGRLVAQRIRESTDRRKEVGHAGAFEGPAVERDEPAAHQPRKAPRMRIEDTALGGSLNDDELQRIGELGEVVTLEAGERVFEQGDPGDRSYIVLGGRIGVVLEGVEGYLNVIKEGELFGEVGLFDDGTRSAGCVAIERAALFSINHASLRALLHSGSGGAWKVLRHLTHSLVRVLRISTLRLREAIALRDGEDESAMRAREQARELQRSRDLSLTVQADLEPGRIPFVEHPEPELSGVACLTAVLRYFGRAVPLVAVAEACSEGAQVTGSSLARGARSFGLTARRLVLDPEDLRFMSAPLMLRDDAGRYIVAERFEAGRVHVMDPAFGRTTLGLDEVRDKYAGVCFEISRDDAPLASLGARLGRTLSEHKRALLPIVAASLLLQLCALAFPVAVGVVVSHVIPAGALSLLQGLALALAALLAASGWWAWERSRALTYLRSKLDLSLLDQLMRHILRLPIPYFERTATGEVMQYFESFRVLRDLLGNQGLRTALDVPTMLLGLAFVAVIDGRMALLAALAIALTALVAAASLPRLRDLAEEELEASRDAQSGLIEAIGGIATLRVCGEADIGMRRWLPHFQRELRAGVSQDLRLTSALGLLDAFRQLTLLGILWWGATLVIDGALSLGGLMAVSSAGALLVLSARGLTENLMAFARAGRRIAQIREVFGRAPEQLADTTAPPGKLRGRIRLDNVSFRYEPDGPLVIDGVSLDIAPGSKLALVGASGSGKSTLGKLLLGFYLPTSGRVSFDGKDLSGLDLGALRSQIGVVLQDSFVFSGTIRDNLSINAPGSELAPLMRAARAAAIHDDISRLPMGYDTLVSEGGSSFSGGQRQRLSLARALVHQPAILLLDEATSALDNISQAAVEANLAELMCTRVVIAHRLSTVVDADHIVVLDRGRIVEQGTHEQMMQRKGRYHELVQAQLA